MPAKKRPASGTAARPMTYPKPTAPPKAPTLKIEIDFPREGERILPGHYAVRLSAPAADGAQISIDGGTWQACRSAAGFFWHDWAPAESGPREIRARALRGGKPGLTVARRGCVVG